MPTPQVSSFSVELAHRVDAFEAALVLSPDADFAEFLPDPAHPFRAAVLAELVRVDLDRAWARGVRRRLPGYLARFPVLAESPVVLASVAFEEYRQRRQYGEDASPAEYQTRYRVDTAGWPVVESDECADGPPTARVSLNATPLPVASLAASSSGFAGSSVIWVPVAGVAVNPPPSPAEKRKPVPDPWLEADDSMPQPGTEFLGFQLVEELGRGAFGRVYLARQGNLGSRLVALKVAHDVDGESRTLAQLQHTNIVPVYSFHKAGPFQAACMPYFGRTTLAQIIRHIHNRPSLPSSGRELRSTVNGQRKSTLPAAGSSHALAPASAPSPDSSPAGEAAPTAPVPAVGQAADGWNRLDGLSYVGAVLTLGGQLADGLAHAHARGILHRDLKPANVLLTDEGRPMLLDFNLAEDTKSRGAAARASIGGTLPYMAPEHIEAFRSASGRLDGRCDVFGLGVILFELLTGRHPFPSYKGAFKDAVPLMLADRRRGAPSLRRWNRDVSPAVDALVRKCLESDPARRYQRADDLREDIDRQLSHRPLAHAANPSLKERAGKWARRNPRLSASGTIAAVAAVLLLAAGAGAVYSRERAHNLHARTAFIDHRAGFRDAQLFLDDRNQSRPQLDEALNRLKGVLVRYEVSGDGTNDGWQNAADVRRLPAAEREQLRADVGETFYLMAQVGYLKAFGADDPAARAEAARAAQWNAAAGRLAGDRLPCAIREQRAALAELRGQADEAAQLRREAQAAADAPRDLYLLGALLAQKGRHRDALPYLTRSTQLDPKNFSAWFVRGTAHLAADQPDQAATCFSACLALRDDFAPAWLNRGLALAQLRRFDQARDDYDRAVQLDPKLAEAYVQRATAQGALGNGKEAVADLTLALDTGAAPVRVYFLRASARQRLGEKKEATADRAAGLALTPADELSWVGRAEARLPADPKGALADVDEALKLNPFSVPGLQLKAHVLGERLNRPADALAVLDRAVEFHPDHVPTLAGRAVELARAGKREPALKDAANALRLDTRPPNLYQIGCVYALTSKTHAEDKGEARRLLWAALRTGFGLDLVDADTDLDPLRADAEFKRLVADAKQLNRPRKP